MAKMIKLLTGFLLFQITGWAQAQLSHQPVTQVKPGERASITVKVDEGEKLKISRVYFRGSHDQSYNFVVLNHLGRGIYAAQLPAPGAGISTIDYRIVTQSADGSVFKSPKYVVAVSGEATAATPSGFIAVYSELPQDLSSQNEGFDDNIRMGYNATRVSSGGNEWLLAEGGGSLPASVAGGVAGSGSELGWGVAGVVALGAGASAITSPSSDDSRSDAGIETEPASGSIDDEHDPQTSSQQTTAYTGNGVVDGILQETINGTAMQGSDGLIRFNLLFFEPVDVDLTVKDPCSNGVGYANTSAQCNQNGYSYTGTLDYDYPHLNRMARGYQDNVFWVSEGPAPHAPAGVYTANVSNFESTPQDYELRVKLGSTTQTVMGTVGAGQTNVHVFNFP